jgi:DNA-directed RNA polymerase subunit RPC12/RpoP
MPMIWFCLNCNYRFGTPISDIKTDEIHCLYCGSSQIGKR